MFGSRLRKREDFPGQRQVVLPPAVVARALRHPLLGGLMPTDAGVYPHAEGHFVDRPEGAAGCVLLVCTAGGGVVGWRQHEHWIDAGGVVLLPAGEMHVYGADAANPWTLEWVHFTGAESAAWCEAILGADPASCVVEIAAAHSPNLGVVRICERLESGYDVPRLLGAAAALRSSLAEIVRLRDVPGHAPTLVEAVDATAQWMRERLERKIELRELAARARLSPSHYSAVFRRRFGFAPIDWLIRQRVQAACRLLDATQDKIESVGAAVGFSDPYYFSRVFRRVMGVSPREYRRTVKG